MLNKKIRLLFLIVIIGILFAGCDSEMYEMPETTPYADDTMPRHVPGEVFESSGFKISYIGVEVVDNLDGQKAYEGHDIYIFDFEFENISDKQKNVFYGCFVCYVDNVLATQLFHYDGMIMGTLAEKGSTTRGTVAFMIPKDAEVVEVLFQYNYDDERLVFVTE